MDSLIENMEKPLIESRNVGKGQIDLSHMIPMVGELRPIELIKKEDGAKDDKPSYCLVMTDGLGAHYYAQFSEATILRALKDCEK